jgi:hypothetical protein
MTNARPLTPSRWCIVVADADGPEWLVRDDSHAQWAPVQYCSLGEPTTMLQKALHRAGRISHATRVVVTVAEAHRSRWQQALWFTRPEHRYVSDFPGTLALLLSRYWSAATHTLLDHLTSSIMPGVENRIPPSLTLEALHVAPRMSWDRPPRIPLRVLRVAHCGWSGLRSPRAIERIVASQSNSSQACLPHRAYRSSAIEHGHAT